MAERGRKVKFNVEPKQQLNVKNLCKKFEKIKVSQTQPPKPPQSVLRRSQTMRSAAASNHRKWVWGTPDSSRSFSYERFSGDSYEDVEELPQKDKHQNQSQSEAPLNHIYDFPTHSNSNPPDEPVYMNLMDFRKFSGLPTYSNDDSHRNMMRSSDNMGDRHIYEIRLSKTQNIIQELLDNERRYIEALGNGIKSFIASFDAVLLPESLIGRRFTIFSNIEAIYEFHETRFLPALLDCGFDVARIADVFTRYIDSNQFDNYIIYVQNKKESEKLCGENKYFFMQLSSDKLGIVSFLLQPIQRLPRYRLLIEELVKELLKDLINNKRAVERCCMAEKNIQKLLMIVNEKCKF